MTDTNQMTKGEKGLKTKRISLLLVLMMVLAIAALSFASKAPAASAQTEGTATVIGSQLYDVKPQPGNDTILLQINVTNGVGIVQAIMNVSWDPTMLKVTIAENVTTNAKSQTALGIVPMYNKTQRYAIYYGDFLGGNSTLTQARSVNNDVGTIERLVVYSQRGGQNGDGTIATINFTVLRQGTTKVLFTTPLVPGIDKDPNFDPNKAGLFDNAIKLIPHDQINGIVSDQPAPIPPIWTQLWFLASVTTVAIVAVPTIAVVAYSKAHKPEKEKVEWEKYDEDEV